MSVHKNLGKFCFGNIRKDERVRKRRDTNSFIKKVKIKEIIYDLAFPLRTQAYLIRGEI
jgi:hypothetical protein